MVKILWGGEREGVKVLQIPKQGCMKESLVDQFLKS